ncbi:MAG: hypothetical protein NZ580_06540 [Bacteroidia bacterium]|nr:hypothetical protein [Bacteroidia bacterium]MDW8235177.1 hypothetical protein [Bacteroidia bacterium]
MADDRHTASAYAAAKESGVVWRVRHYTRRLAYIVETFHSWSDLPYVIVEDEVWTSYTPPTGWRIVSYGSRIKEKADWELPYSGFLEKEGTHFLLPSWNEGGFFPGEGDFGWDLLAMGFYVLTLYPLYDWPYGYDEWGLYAWHRAPFYEAPFWKEPFLLKRWYELLERLELHLPKPPFHWEIGWDIDHLYAWKGRDGLRWWLGGIRRGNLHLRLLARWGKVPDPYNTLSLITAHFPPQHARFFFLLSQKHSRDSLVSPSHPELIQAIQNLHAQGYCIGIHPSFTTRENPSLLIQEKHLLEQYLKKPVECSRQHYLRFFVPQLFVSLVEAGIKEDYTLTFPKRSGFLLGTTLPIRAYRVDTDEVLPLWLIGPALMDQVYLSQGKAAELPLEVSRLFSVVKETGGRLHFLWHNSTWEALPLTIFLEAQVK